MISILRKLACCWLILILPGQVLAGVVQMRQQIESASAFGKSHGVSTPAHATVSAVASAPAGHHATDQPASVKTDCPHHRTAAGSDHPPDPTDGAGATGTCSDCALCCLMLIPATTLALPDPPSRLWLAAPDDAFQSMAPQVLERPPRRFSPL